MINRPVVSRISSQRSISSSRKTRIGSVEDVISRAAGERLVLLNLFDVYRGEQVPEGTMSLAFSLSLRDPERTLTDDDADAVMDAIARAAGAAGWTIRA